MQSLILKRPFSKVAIIAGCPSSDYKGSQIIKSIRKNNPNTSFFGLGGPEMSSHPNFQNHANLAHLPDKPFYPIFHYDVDPRFYLNFAMIRENITILPAFYQLYKNGFWKNFDRQKQSDVDVVITLDNQLFAFRLLEHLDTLYETHNSFKPLRIHFDKTIRNYNWDYLRSIDFLFYSLPLASKDPQRYEFPSQFIGKQVVYDALRFLYSTSNSFSKLLQSDCINADVQSTFELARQFKLHMRSLYRQRKNLPESAFLLYFSLGSNVTEVATHAQIALSASMEFQEKCREGQQVALAVNFPFEDETFIKIIEAFRQTGMSVKFIFGNRDNDRYEAMAAADLGAVTNGDSVFEAATFQLPTVIMDHVSGYNGYMSLMFNVFNSEINWLVNGQILPELSLRNFSGKLVEFWLLWLEKPHLKIEIANRFYKSIFSLLPSEKSVSYESSKEHKSGDGYQVCLNPELVIQDCLDSKIKSFKHLKETCKGPGDFSLKRKEMLN